MLACHDGTTHQTYHKVMINMIIQCYLPRGAIWYQGETNVWNENRDLYGCAFPSMIDTWRKLWSAR